MTAEDALGVLTLLLFLLLVGGLGTFAVVRLIS